MLGHGDAEIGLLAFWRRSIRSGQSWTVFAVELEAIHTLLETARTHRMQSALLRELAGRENGLLFALANGDIVVALPDLPAGRRQALLDEIVGWILREPDMPAEGVARRVHCFVLPEHFLQVREWIGRYLDPAAAPQAPGPAAREEDPSTEALAGPLTPTLLGRIEHRVAHCDIRPFIHRQMVYARNPEGRERWTPVLEEHLIGVADLGRALFADVELTETSPFFAQFCGILDERLIHHMMAGKARFSAPISINLSLDTVFDRLFDAFAAHIPEAARPLLYIELHCGDLFRDVARAQAAIQRLRARKFGVVLDGLTIDLLSYVRVNRFGGDYVKIHMPRGDAAMLLDDACIKAVRSLPRESVVFSRCDHEGALRIGEMLDVRLYQGWTVDGYARAAGRG